MIAFSRMISTGNICRSNPMLYQRFLSITGNNGNNDNSNSIFNIDNFAKFDMARESRCGFPEVIFASGKTNEHLIKICEKLYQQDKQFIATRVSSSQFEYIRSKLDIQNIEYVYDPITMILYSKIYQQPLIKGSVAVLCAGTSDFQVAEEAAKILELSGVSHISRVYDVGVAGIHRLFANYDKFKDCDVVICCAGMDGALPSVVGGIVKAPVIAVPTSIGYGASFQGVSALLTMLNTCSPGVTVVNIDNGFGAAVTAFKIIKKNHR